MNAPIQPQKQKPPETSDEQREFAWRFVGVLLDGVRPALAAARAAEGTPDAWKKADEVVRMLDSVLSTARMARDTIQAPQGSPPDQLGWFKVMMTEMDATMKRAFERMTTDVATTVARKIDEKREK